MDTEYKFSTQVEWKGGKIGELQSDGFPKVNVATPVEFPNGVPNVWSPEHLFVAAAEVCLMTTFTGIAEASKVDLVSYKSSAEGKVERIDGKFRFTEIIISPEIVVAREKDVERAERLINKAKELCLVSNSLTADVRIDYKITLAAN
ncbi:MAG: OsmC family peroxiredoxin [Chlorobi bacterium]|nr:OsmC family peroxiredoxin [Chlorobiota bacterium]